MGENTPKHSCELQNYSLECQNEGNVAVPSNPNESAKTGTVYPFLTICYLLFEWFVFIFDYFELMWNRWILSSINIWL